MSTPTAYKHILDRLRVIQGKAASAKVQPDTEALNMKDPAEKGTVNPPDHPEGDSPDKTQTPAEPTNPDTHDSRVPGEDLNPSGIEDPKTLPAKKEDPVKGDNDVAENTTKAGGEDTVSEKVAGIMDRLNKIRGTKEASEEGKEKEEDPAEGAQKKEEGKEEDPAKEAGEKAKEEDPAEGAQKKEEGKEEDPAKEAGEEDLPSEFTPEFHMKLASELLATEEGVALAQQILSKSAGEEAAKELIEAAGQQQYMAALQEQELQKQAAAEEEALWKQAAELEEVLKDASEEDLGKIERSILIHDKIASELEYDFEKVAYSQGVETAAGMEDMMAEGEALPEEAPAPSTEEILMLLDAAVQSGEVSEEDAIAIAEMLMADEAGGMEGGEAGMEDMSEEDMAALEAATKAASEIE